jgi:hypothetical protein
MYIIIRIYVFIPTYIMISYAIRQSNVSGTPNYIYYKTL